LKLLSGMGVGVYVLIADAFGTVMEQCSKLPVVVKIFDIDNAAESKKEIAESLGCEVTAAI